MKCYDITVIGGGIAGAGVAQAAVAAGYKVLLIEKGEYAEQTSSRSSKLIHGGLRYLESGQFHLVYTALKARRELMNLAPHLVKPVPFNIPVYDDSRRGKWTLRAGLFLYGLLCFLDPMSRYRDLRRSQWGHLAGINKKGLKAVFQYWDAQTDDQALTLSVLKSAEKLGADLLKQTKVTAINSKEAGFEVSYQANDVSESIYSHMIINAAGPWVNEVLTQINTSIPQFKIDWVQGTHIVIDMPALDYMYYLESKEDERVVFVMPWKGKTMVGTTEVVLKDLPQKTEPSQEEINYLLRVFADYFPDQNIELIEAFAGVRVLPKVTSKAFSRERESVVYQAENTPRVITLYGGKLTTFRPTSKKVIKQIEVQLGKRIPIADIDTLKLD